jgi:hypothetical protein
MHVHTSRHVRFTYQTPALFSLLVITLFLRHRERLGYLTCFGVIKQARVDRRRPRGSPAR